MPRKFKDIIKLIEKDGWVLVAQVGSHRPVQASYQTWSRNYCCA